LSSYLPYPDPDLVKHIIKVVVYNECIGIHVKSKEIEFVGRITKMKDRMYIEIPKDSRKEFEEFSKDSLIVKVRKVLG
jgi:hypothetical protein